MKISRQVLVNQAAAKFRDRSRFSGPNRNQELGTVLQTLRIADVTSDDALEFLSQSLGAAQQGNLENLRQHLKDFAASTKTFSTEELYTLAGLLCAVAPSEPRQLSSNIIQETEFALGGDAFEAKNVPYFLSQKVEYSTWQVGPAKLGFDIVDPQDPVPLEFWQQVQDAMKHGFFATIASKDDAAALQNNAEKWVTLLKTQTGTELLTQAKNLLNIPEANELEFLLLMVRRLHPELSYDVLLDAAELNAIPRIQGSRAGIFEVAKAFIQNDLSPDERASCVRLLRKNRKLRYLITRLRSELPYGEAKASDEAARLLKELASRVKDKKTNLENLKKHLEAMLTSQAWGLEDIAISHLQDLTEENRQAILDKHGNVFVPLGKTVPLNLEELEKLPLEDHRVCQQIFQWLWTFEIHNIHDEEMQQQAIQSLLARKDYSKNQAFIQKLRAFADKTSFEGVELYRRDLDLSRYVASALVRKPREMFDPWSPPRSALDKVKNRDSLDTRTEFLSVARVLFENAKRDRQIDASTVEKFRKAFRFRSAEIAITEVLQEWDRLGSENSGTENLVLTLKLSLLSKDESVSPEELALLGSLNGSQKQLFDTISGWTIQYKNDPTHSLSANDSMTWRQRFLPGASDADKIKFLALYKAYNKHEGELTALSDAPKAQAVLLKLRMCEAVFDFKGIETLFGYSGLQKLSSQDQNRLFPFITSKVLLDEMSTWQFESHFQCCVHFAKRLDEEDPAGRVTQVFSNVAAEFYQAASRETPKDDAFIRTFATQLREARTNHVSVVLETWEKLEKDSRLSAEATEAVLSMKLKLLSELGRVDLMVPLLENLNSEQRSSLTSVRPESSNWLKAYDDAVQSLGDFQGSSKAKSLLLRLKIKTEVAREVVLTSIFEDELQSLSAPEKQELLPYLQEELFNRSKDLNLSLVSQFLLPLAREVDRNSPAESISSREFSAFQAAATWLREEIIEGRYEAEYSKEFAGLLASSSPDISTAVFKQWQELQLPASQEANAVEIENELFVMKYNFVSALKRDDLAWELFDSMSEAIRQDLRKEFSQVVQTVETSHRGSREQVIDHALWQNSRGRLFRLDTNTQKRFYNQFAAFEEVQALKAAQHVKQAILALKMMHIDGQTDIAKAIEMLTNLGAQDQKLVLRHLMATPVPLTTDFETEFWWHCWMSSMMPRAEKAVELKPSKDLSVTTEQSAKFAKVFQGDNFKFEALASQGFPGLKSESLKELVRITVHHLSRSPSNAVNAQQYAGVIEGDVKIMLHSFIRACGDSLLTLNDQELTYLSKSHNCSPEQLLVLAQKFALKKYESNLPHLNRPKPNELGQPANRNRIAVDFSTDFFFRAMAEFIYGKSDVISVRNLQFRRNQSDSALVEIAKNLQGDPQEIQKCLDFVEKELPQILSTAKAASSGRNQAEAPIERINAAGIAIFLKSSAAYDMHQDRKEILSKAVESNWTTSLGDKNYKRSINRIVQRNFELSYIRACQLNDGKSATVQKMEAVRNAALNHCVLFLQVYFKSKSAKHLGRLEIKEIQQRLALGISAAFQTFSLTATPDQLLKTEKADFLESKVSLHDLEISNEIGRAERFLKGVQMGQQRLPAEKRLAPESFELLRTVLRIAGGSFQKEADELRELARNNSNFVMQKDKKIFSGTDSLLSTLVDTLNKIASSVMLGKNFGGEKEFVYRHETELLPAVRVRKISKYDEFTAEYELAVPGQKEPVTVSSGADALQLERNHTVRRVLSKMLPEFLSLPSNFVISDHENSDALASATLETRTVTIYPSAFGPEENLSHTLYHEIGHFLFDAVTENQTPRSSESRNWGTAVAPRNAWLKRWCEAVEADGLMDTAYANENPSEAFCERLALYCTSLPDTSRHGVLRRVYPRTFSMLDDVRQMVLTSHQRAIEMSELSKGNAVLV